MKYLVTILVKGSSVHSRPHIQTKIIDGPVAEWYVSELEGIRGKGDKCTMALLNHVELAGEIDLNATREDLNDFERGLVWL